VLDNPINIDELCTFRQTGIANFRQLVGWPIYGASQPDGQAVSQVQAQMTKAYWSVALDNMRVDERLSNAANEESNRTPVSMPTVIWISLRDEFVYDRGGETGTWRAKDEHTKPILLTGISGMELEELEENFVSLLNNLGNACTPYRVDIDTNKLIESDRPIATEIFSSKSMFKRAFESTSSALAGATLDSQAINIPDSYVDYVKRHAEYHRIPVPPYGPPPAAVFDQILRLVVNNARGLMTSTITVQSLVDASEGIVRRHSCHRSPGGSTDSSKEWHLPNSDKATIERIGLTNMIFFCESGRERTSLAMSVAGLVYCHIVGFAFGYRVDEEERISLRGAKYTKGDFQVIQRLVRMIPHGHQVKREVDYVLDRCFDSMSMMHFHVREQIYFTYVKFQEEMDSGKKDELKRQSLAFLETYFYLILFNLYLHDCESTRWKSSFETWLEQFASRCNYMALLDNLGFPEFEKPDDLRRIRERWRPHSTTVSQVGSIV
ncbi:Paladin, partial [Fasciola gigantica]